MSYWMIRSNQVGYADHGWLKAKHYFSFGSYYNPERMGFGQLRVINDDVVEAHKGFGTHPHKDMEIITIPLSGAVSHEDSFGHKGRITKGEVQVMSAGTGIRHSEFNHESVALNLFQIWIQPNEMNVSPRYDQRTFNYHEQKNQWTTLISPIKKPDEEGLKIHQNAYIHATVIDAHKSLSYKLKDKNNGAFVLIADGEVKINNEVLKKRDSIAISHESEILIEAQSLTDIIVIEVPLT